ncbi:hypothetical protein V6N13_055684 [Hibiscus sabdariffa]
MTRQLLVPESPMKYAKLMTFSPTIALSPQMDESLRIAASTGNVSELYSLVQGDGNILRRFDEVEFIGTPLHIAAEEGCIGFAMEIMNLKPSMARKLNQQGLSPMHLAVKKGHTEIGLRLLEIDKDLVRIRGRKGKTPLHYICKVGDHDGLLDTFLEACPDSIGDVTTRNRTSLHIAVRNRRLDVLRALIRTLRKKDYYREVVNRKDEDGNTALHIAASDNQPQMLKLLLECKADKHVINHDATYQTTLSPPGGVSEGQSSSTSTSTSADVGKIGISVMQQATVLLFYIPTYIAFLVAFFLTLALLKPFPRGFRTSLQILLAFLGYASSNRYAS